jgi:hypothetical protein
MNDASMKRLITDNRQVQSKNFHREKLHKNAAWR